MLNIVKWYESEVGQSIAPFDAKSMSTITDCGVIPLIT